MVMTVRLVSGHRGDTTVTDYHWVRLVLRASGGHNRYRLPLGSSENRGRHDCNHANSAPPIFIGWGEHSDGHDCSFGSQGIPGDTTATDYHWVPLKIGADTTAIMQTRPRPFSSGGASIPMVMTVRLVSGHSGDTTVTDYHWVRLVSGHSGDTTATDYHWVRLVSGHRGDTTATDYHWVRLVSGHSGDTTVTDYHWVRLVSGHRRSGSPSAGQQHERR